MSQSTKYIANFEIGQLALELVEYTTDKCGKRKDKCGNFPYRLYNTFVDRIVNNALDIHEDVIMANTLPVGDEERARLQIEALGKLTVIQQQIRVCYNKKWISDKQLNIWVGKCSTPWFKIKAWRKKG